MTRDLTIKYAFVNNRKEENDKQFLLCEPFAAGNVATMYSSTIIRWINLGHWMHDMALGSLLADFFRFYVSNIHVLEHISHAHVILYQLSWLMYTHTAYIRYLFIRVFAYKVSHTRFLIALARTLINRLIK